MTDFPAFAAGMLAICAVALFTGWRHRGLREQLWRTSAALFFNWALGSLFVWISGNYTPWAVWIFLDASAAFMVMYHPAGRAQAYIGLFYFFQIAGHIAYGGRELFGLSTDSVYYYDAITWVAWAQLLAVGLWCGGHWFQTVLHHIRHRGNALDRGTPAKQNRGKP